MTDLKESRITTEVVYKGDFLDVRRDEVLLPNGETGTREWINHPGAVCIIPILLKLYEVLYKIMFISIFFFNSFWRDFSFNRSFFSS